MKNKSNLLVTFVGCSKMVTTHYINTQSSASDKKNIRGNLCSGSSIWVKNHGSIILSASAEIPRLLINMYEFYIVYIFGEIIVGRLD